MEWDNKNYRISTTKSELDREVIHAFLANSYWAKGIPKNIVDRSIEGSFCFGVFQNEAQVGFARLITDEATFAYLADVFILPAHQGQGLGKWLVACMLEYCTQQGLRSVMLATADAHGLYQQFGFKPLSQPEKYMGIHNPTIYTDQA